MARFFVVLLLTLVATFSSTKTVEATQMAILVGAGKYADDRITNLEGPRYDVLALKAVLRKKWGFKKENIVTLLNRKATKANILASLHRFLAQSQEGDSLFLYLSGHGTSRKASASMTFLPYESGAFIPADLILTPSQVKKGLLIGRRDLRPALEKLDRAGRHVFVAMDACYSGNAVRSLGGHLSSGLKPRFVALPFLDEALAMDTPEPRSRSLAPGEPSDYPYKNVYFLSAATDAETALDISDGGTQTLDGHPHGAFTDALLRVLDGRIQGDADHNQRLTYNELKNAVRAHLRRTQIPHTPQGLPKDGQDHTGFGQQLVFNYHPNTQNLPPPPPAQPPQTGPLKVAFGAGTETLKTTLAPTLNQMNGVTTTPPEQAHIILKREGDHTLFVSRNGELLYTMSDAEPEEIAHRIHRQLWMDAMTERTIPGQAYNVSLNLLGARDAGYVVEGETVGFEMIPRRPAHLLLVNINAAGMLYVLYPVTEEELALVTPEAPLRLLDQVDVAPPFGVDVLKVFAFTSLPPVLKELMGQDALSPESPLVKRLEQSLDQVRFGASQTTLKITSVPAR